MRSKHINFLEHIRDISGLSLSAIARAANIADTTLTRFMNKSEIEALSAQTLNKVAKIGGYENYEDFLLMNNSSGNFIVTNKVKITDAQKFEIYESVRKLIEKANKNNSVNSNKISQITQEVINHMQILNTNFVSESLIAYVLEKDNLLKVKT